MINFMRFRLLYLLFSLLVILPGMYTLLRFGLKPGIDFTGGTVLELQMINDKFQNKNEALTIIEEKIKPISKELNLEIENIQKIENQNLLLQLKPVENEQKQQFVASISASLGEVQEVRYETVGPVLGKELLQKTMIAALCAVLIILSYIAWAFKDFKYGISAILALIHDLLVVVSVFAILGKYWGVEVDTLFVTALLTTMSFSVHDTIVVFDRIREVNKKSRDSFEGIINQALSETMVRSLNNSLTIIFMLLALFLLGGETIKWFVFALLIGTISGTYSSPFVATPILYTLQKFRK